MAVHHWNVTRGVKCDPAMFLPKLVSGEVGVWEIKNQVETFV